MTKEECRKLLDRHEELFEKQDRTPAEQYEMKRILHQIKLFAAEGSGMTKEEYREEQRVVVQFYRAARALSLSEVCFGIGGAAVGAHHQGQTEEEFAESFKETFNDEEVFKIGRDELKAAELWPWR
jgi:hypothetical protein